MSPNNAWVTLATNDSYSLGALVLAHSLKTVNTAHKLAILITPGVTASMKHQIETVFDDVRVVDVLDSRDQTHLALMCRPELGVTFTKLHCWTLTEYDKCVFLDADTMVLQNCDELFERDELSAAPDPGWPDCFNSGVFVYKPSQDTFAQLLEFARTRGSFDGGDQGLLNMFFKEWAHKDISKHLSFTYNVVWSSTYSYLPALKQFGQNMKIIHFIASSKPWLQSFNTETKLVTATCGGSGLQALLQLWWDLFCRHVHPGLSNEMGGLAGQFAKVTLGEKTADQKSLEDFLRRQSWEQGNMDYLGRDSFSNIWAKISETLGNTSEVQIGPGVVKTPSPPEIVHTEEPRPLKSVLKKTSTTVPPVESEIVESNEPSVKLEKLDLSKMILKQIKTPDTPTVTSPTPPTTPATHIQELSKPVESIKETPKSNKCTKESTESVKHELPIAEPVKPSEDTPKSDTSADDTLSLVKQEPVECKKETSKSDASTERSLSSVKQEPVELKEETPKSDESAEKHLSSVKLEKLPKSEIIEPIEPSPKPETTSVESVSSIAQNLTKSESSISKLVEPVKEISEPKTETSQIASVGNDTPLESNDPPIAPKRTNKSSANTLKNNKLPEKK